MRRAVPRLAALLTLAALAGPPAAQALTVPPPHPYKQVTANGAYVFVMLPPLHEGRAEPPAWQAIRRAYPKSGLYRNDGSNVPLWTVDWWARHVDVASDGTHLVRYGDSRWAEEAEAYGFFAGGQLLRAYKVSDIVAMTSLGPPTPQERWWRAWWLEKEQFDDDGLTLSVQTKDGRHFVFDMTTGQARFAGAGVVAAVGGWGWALVITLGLVGVVSAVVVWLGWRPALAESGLAPRPQRPAPQSDAVNERRSPRGQAPARQARLAGPADSRLRRRE